MINKKMRKKISVIIIAMMMGLSLVACGNDDTSSSSVEEVVAESTADVDIDEEFEDSGSNEETEKEVETEENNTESDAQESEEVVTTANVTADGMIDATDMFTERDMTQTADLSEAEYLELKEGEDINISAAGVYVVSGNASNVTIFVEAGDEDKVQIVLDGASITNETAPAIYVKSADKVFVTTTDSDNSLEVTGTFEADGDTNLDAVIFSKEDLVINGLGTLNITSSDNAVTSKDTLKVTGGTINVSCSGSALEAHDAVEIADGTINVTDSNDGIHAEDSDDDSVGYVYICGGTINITAADDAIHGTTVVQIDDGNITLNAAECIEGTYIQINGGDINIEASDDGINAAYKSNSYTPTFEMNDGTVTINMGQGDTDGVDSNGNVYVNGGTLDISGQSTFDYDGTAEYNGGTIIENGTETNTITNQLLGGGGMGGGPGGGMGAPDDGMFGPQ
ncbi:MAG: carbohydrate-binding domain-containing protein [Eubacterium sp.]|nr:carbohydrate-binding domain-containing protein [Eubacterium sp.]